MKKKIKLTAYLLPSWLGLQDSFASWTLFFGGEGSLHLSEPSARD
jgi:hypothetical protein